jgi:hypothetical protein
MVVLKEPYTEPMPNDRFTVKKFTKYRVLYLDPLTHKYFQDVYDDKIGIDRPSEEKIEIKMNNEQLDEIPFYTLPGKLPEKSMLYDLAQLNLQHYQDTADYQNGKHYTSVPTPIAIGLEPEYEEDGITPKPMSIGGTEFKYFPNKDQNPRADVKYLEYTGTGMKCMSEGLTHLEGQMAITGAHIIAAEKKGVEAPEALKIHRIGENGVLASFIRNSSMAITMACRKKGQWDGEDVNKLNTWAVNFNTDYDLSDEDVQILTAVLTGRSNGEIPRISVYFTLKQMNLIPEQWDYETFVLENQKDRETDQLPEMKDDDPAVDDKKKFDEEGED